MQSHVYSTKINVSEFIRQFFNGHDMGSNKATWVKWNSILTDKNHGGLRVSNLYALNRCLMLKWMGGRSCWLFIVNEIRVLRIKGVDIFEFLKLRLGNGDMINFWLDNWYEGGILKNILSRLYALENEKEVTVSSKLDDLNLECSFRRTVRGVGVELGEFGSDALPTQINISQRGINIQSISCPICAHGAETSDHLFFKCNMVREIGRKIARWWNINFEEILYVMTSQVLQGEISLKHVGTDGQVADLFTKGMNGNKLKNFSHQLGMVKLTEVGDGNMVFEVLKWWCFSGGSRWRVVVAWRVKGAFGSLDPKTLT
nr:RNA-directed DNA polymerase, eukaryota [Tanacetum cinerariifolium]